MDNNQIVVESEPTRDELIYQILLNLKIIANIKEYDKVTTGQEHVEIDRPSILQGLRRALRGDSRINTLERVKQIIDQAFKVTDEILEEEYDANQPDIPNKPFKEENSHLFQRFIMELSNASKGLENLKITYKDDISIISKLDLIIDKINMRVEKINKLLFIRV